MTAVWNKIGGENLTVTGDKVTVKSQSGQGYSSYETETGGKLIYTCQIDRPGLMCVNLDLPAKNSFSFWKNGEMLYEESLSLPQLLSVCDVEPGDKIEIRISCKKGESGTANVLSAVLDEERFREGYEILAASTLELTEFSNTYIAGTIDCNRDGLLYTSIPQNASSDSDSLMNKIVPDGGRWVATVDGEEAEITLVGDAMVSLNLTEGRHTVEFRYENESFELGWKISLGCLLVLLSITALAYYPKWKKKHSK